jgi:hypothetical protein
MRRGFSYPGPGVAVRPNRSSLQARACLKELIDTTPGVTSTALSRLIGKPDPYLSTFIRTGTPTRLDRMDRIKLARFFGIKEQRLV